MAGFSPLRSNVIEEDIDLPISSLTLAIGDLLELDVGATTWTEGTSATEHWQQKAVCTESATTADSFVKARVISTIGQLFEVESANDSDTADNGDRMLLTDKNTVNNTGTDNTSEEACFVQRGIIGAVGDKRIYGYIVPGTGINPDAA